jgi:hypothetical protein
MSVIYNPTCKNNSNSFNAFNATLRDPSGKDQTATVRFTVNGVQKTYGVIDKLHGVYTLPSQGLNLNSAKSEFENIRQRYQKEGYTIQPFCKP